MVRRVRIDLLRILLLGCVVAGFVMAAVAYYEVEILNRAVAEGAYHKIVFGDIAMLTALLLLAALSFHRGPLVLQGLMLVSAGCGIYASILSHSRGAWLALPVVLLFIVWAGFINKRMHLRRPAMGIVAVLVAILALTFPVVQQKFETSYESLAAYLDGSNPQTSIGQRLQMWGIALEVWRQHPLVGTGLGDFKHHVRQRLDSEQAQLDLVFSHAHNIYLEFLATTGSIGLLVMVVTILVLPLLLMIDRYRHAKSALSRNAALAGGVLIVSFAIFGLTEAWTARSPMMSTYVVMLAVLMACASRADEA
jgi:O-antigen ligase